MTSSFFLVNFFKFSDLFSTSFRSWNKQGAHINMSTEDLRDSKNAHTFLKKVDADPVEGIYLVASKGSKFKMNSEVVKVLDQFARKHMKTLK